MPIYEYQCGGCNQVFEVRQKLSDPAPVEHTCGSRSIKRILSNTSFVLKGTGWYKTDYATKPQEPKGQSEGQKTGAAAPASGGDASATKKAEQTPKTPAKTGGGGSEAA